MFPSPPNSDPVGGSLLASTKGAMAPFADAVGRTRLCRPACGNLAASPSNYRSATLPTGCRYLAAEFLQSLIALRRQRPPCAGKLNMVTREMTLSLLQTLPRETCWSCSISPKTCRVTRCQWRTSTRDRLYRQQTDHQPHDRRDLRPPPYGLAICSRGLSDGKNVRAASCPPGCHSSGSSPADLPQTGFAVGQVPAPYYRFHSDWLQRFAPPAARLGSFGQDHPLAGTGAGRLPRGGQR